MRTARHRLLPALTLAALMAASPAAPHPQEKPAPVPPPAAPAPAETPSPAATPAAPTSIAWMEWSNAVFERSAREDKPILLNIIASWSRDTAFSEAEVYSDPEVIDLIMRRWIPVRVDRDRRPDIDLRYQLAVNAVNPKEQGLPLTAFLLQSGEAVYGRAQIQADDRSQKLGLKTMLEQTADSYEKQRERLSSGKALVAMAFNREKANFRGGEITEAAIHEVAEVVDTQFDSEQGGFNGVPRSTAALILELCATLMHRGTMPRAREILDTTLRGMEQGTIHDRVGKGFHSRTRDRVWRYPEFEKLLIINASLITPYLLGWQATGNPDYRAAAESAVDFLLTTLREPGGAFYLAQWSSVAGELERGMYYTWTSDEFQKLVPPADADIARTLYHVVPEGDLRLGDPPRNLLFMATSRGDAAFRLGVTESAVRAAEARILAALTAARAKREAPPVQKAVYVDSAAAAVTALFAAAEALDRADARAAAREALDRLLRAVPQGSPLLHRVTPPPVPGEDPALAQDHLMLARAALAGYEDSGERAYLRAAQDLVARAHALFWDATEGGYYDVVNDPNAPGYLFVRRRLLNDRGYPALSAQAAWVLDRLTLHTGEQQFRDQATACLQVLLKHSERLALNDAALALAIDGHLRPPTRFVIVAEDSDARGAELQRAAWKVFDPGKVVVRLRPGADDDILARLKLKKRGGAYAVICRGDVCGKPVEDPAGLAQPAAPAAAGTAPAALR